jgi:DedD protein
MDTKVEARPEVKVESKATPKVEPTVTAAKPAASKPAEKKVTEKARAEAALSGDAEPAAASGGQWVVQLGAYKDAVNVKQLTAKLKGMGVASYTEKFESPQGPRTRVRAGPFPTKEAAEKAQAKAKAIGVSGPVAPK